MKALIQKVLLGGVAALVSLPTQASVVEQFAAFAGEAKALGFPSRFLDAAIGELGSLKPVSASDLGAATAYYRPFFNRIYVDSSIYDPGLEQLKPISEMGISSAASVIHELWHCYFANVFHETSAGLAFDLQASDLYRDQAEDVRSEILEEAYALYIQFTAENYFFHRQILSKAAPGLRQKLLRNPAWVRSYESVFARPIQGYYDSGKSPVWVKAPLPDANKTFILKQILDWDLTGKVDHDFREFLAPGAI